MEKELENSRKQGIASPDKKMGRIAAECVLSTDIKGTTGAMVAVNCETDFVAKNAGFKALANEIAKVIVDKNPENLDALNKAQTSDGTVVEEYIKAQIAKIGEKITIRRFTRYDDDSMVSTYVHNNKIGVLLEVKAQTDNDETRTI